MTANVKMFAMTETEKTDVLLDAIQDRVEAELEVVRKEEELLNKSSSDYLAAKQRVENKKNEIVARGAADELKILDESAAATVKKYEDILSPIQAAWDSQLRGLLAHTTTWQQAMRNIFESLMLDLIKAIEAYFVKKAALMLASALGPDPAGLTAAFKGITTNLGQAYAGFAAFFAPILGPGAPAAAAAATAEIGATAYGLSAAGSAEQGAWNVPATSPWMLHRGETVLPAQAAEGFRRMASGGGSFAGGGSVVIQAWDGADVVRTLQRHAPLISRVVSGYQGANPSSHG
jgi:hypothetical protein